jgi:hypothetical protein
MSKLENRFPFVFITPPSTGEGNHIQHTTQQEGLQTKVFVQSTPLRLVF